MFEGPLTYIGLIIDEQVYPLSRRDLVTPLYVYRGLGMQKSEQPEPISNLDQESLSTSKMNIKSDNTEIMTDASAGPMRQPRQQTTPHSHFDDPSMAYYRSRAGKSLPNPYLVWANDGLPVYPICRSHGLTCIPHHWEDEETRDSDIDLHNDNHNGYEAKDDKMKIVENHANEGERSTNASSSTSLPISVSSPSSSAPISPTLLSLLLSSTSQSSPFSAPAPFERPIASSIVNPPVDVELVCKVDHIFCSGKRFPVQ